MTCASSTATVGRGRPATRPLRPRLRLALLLALPGGVSSAQDAPGWPDVLSLFEERCVMCHSGEHAALGLHLDSHAGAVAGSRNGPVLVPRDPSASELVRRIRGESQPRMPFLSYPLSADEIAMLERWIEAGLPDG